MKSSSVADSAADILRREIVLRMRGDPFLGSEEEVARDLGISKPSLRQATRLLESEQILTVRRGPGGGLFIRKPSEEIVLRIVDLYLTSIETPFSEILLTLVPLLMETVRNIALSADPAIRRTPIDFLRENKVRILSTSESGFGDALGEYGTVLANLSGNRALSLFTKVIMGLRYPEPLVFTSTNRRAHLRNLEAIAIEMSAGDAENAASLVRSSLTTLLHQLEGSERRGGAHG